MTKVSLQDVTKAYRFYAPIYDKLFGAVLEPGRRALAESVADMDNAKILEVGVGTGLTLSRYPVRSEIVGVDVCKEMLGRARARLSELEDRAISLCLMDGERLDFPNASFDCVTLPYVMSVTPDSEKLVREVRRVCRPGGRIVILNHFSGSGFWWLLERMAKPLADRIGFQSEFSYEKHVLGHDWIVERSCYVNVFNLSRLVVLRN